MAAGRKGNHEGSIYKDKQGRWRGLVSMPSTNGKYKRKYLYGKTRREVSEKMNDLLNQLRTNTYIEPCKITLYDWLCTWLDTYCKNEVRMTTYINYETYVHKHIKNTIGGYRLCDLSTLLIQQFYNEKSKNGRLDGKGGLSPKTMKNIHDMLHRALDKAVQLEMMQKNYSDATVLPKRIKPEIRYYSTDEQKQLQEAIKGERLEMAVLLALYTGVRQGELLGLPWSNVHINLDGNSYIRITQALNRIRNPDTNSDKRTILQINPPKTKHSIRTIPLLPKIAQRLYDYKEEQADFIDKNNLPDSGLVFIAANGAPYDPRDFQRDFKNLLKRHELRDIGVHGLRHSFATRSLQSGMSIKTLSAILGHNSCSFTMDVYCHIDPDITADEISCLGNMLD
ncbi:MAG: tyrosine recombinase XerC [Ruminococcus sp.]